MEKSPHSSAFHAWRPAAWLRVFGPDSGAFLQGQFTNDLRDIRAPGDAVYGLWLNQKGKVLADSFVVGAGENAFWLGSYFSAAAVIRERLDAYLIADDVTIEDLTNEWTGVTVMGGPRAASNDAIAFAGRRGGREPAREYLIPSTGAAEFIGSLKGATELSADEMERRRIDARIPAVPCDVGPGDLPNEAGLETVAISYNKGCYLGQEVMARLHSMGQVRRRLLRVTGSGPIPSLPAPLFQGERKIGELRSAVAQANDFIGLAMVSLVNLDAKSPAHLSAPSGSTVALEMP